MVLLLLTAVNAANLPAAEDANPPKDTIRIAIGGDVMLDGGPGHALLQGEDPFADVADILASADIAICNLECALTAEGTQVLKAYTFKAWPECIPILKRHFAAVCIANNHACDYGPDGFVDELGLLEKSHLACFGGGHDRKEALRPLILERNGRRIALLGYNDFPPRSFEATDDKPGIAWLTLANAIAGVKAARKEHHADLVIPILHWGEELSAAPDDSQKSLARELIDAGADAVIGGHPHVTQTIDFYKGKPIVYSLGNFVFDYFPGDPPVWSGWIVRLTFSGSQPPQLETFAMELDRTGIPHLVPAAAE